MVNAGFEIEGPVDNVAVEVATYRELWRRMFRQALEAAQIWEGDIWEIEFGPGDHAGVVKAFNIRRCFEFRAGELNPRGLVQESGDPVWLWENGALMHGLIAEVLADIPETRSSAQAVG